MILEKRAEEAKTTVEQLLSNVITYTSAELRQPLVNIKNYSHLLLTQKRLPEEKAVTYLKRIYESSVMALRNINRFDEEATGRRIQGKVEKVETEENEKENN